MSKSHMSRTKTKNAVRTLKQEGLLGLSVKVLQKAQNRQRRGSKGVKIKPNFLVKYDDVLKADWSTHPYKYTKHKVAPPYTINWVISPPNEGLGGGHQNIFRFISYLVEQGHYCNVYLYSGQHHQDAQDAHSVFKEAHPGINITMQWLDGPMQSADAVFATGWETAYPVFNDTGKALKCYFIQDFEPYFYPIGSEYVLSENTYRFNFFGITAGKWLAHKLSKDYHMTTDFYDFATNNQIYKFENKNKRNEIFFYARPVTARRGFELGLMTLDLFHQQRPDYIITLAGWDVSEYDIPFPHKNLKALKLNQLSDIYNQCAAGLVISLTNMSLLPLELLGAGTIPVVTDGPNNKDVSANPFIKYAQSSPDALAKALVEVVDKKDLTSYAQKAAQSVSNLDWRQSCARFEQILSGELNG